MELSFALLAGSASVTPQGGLAILEAGLDGVNFDQGAKAITIVAKFSFARSEVGTQHTLELLHKDSDGVPQRIGKKIDINVIPSTAAEEISALMFVGNVTISDPTHGAHRIELVFDGKLLKTLPFFINSSNSKKQEVTDGA